MSKNWREKLLQLREELTSIADAASDSAAIVELDQSKVGRLSRMDAMQGQAMAKASNERRERQLRLIEAALRRVDRDEYGYCQKCEEPIDTSRLEFDPTVLLCIDCAKQAESR